MGLSVAIAGAIILSVLMLVMMSMTGLVGNIFSIGSVTTQVSDLENSIDDTDISLETLFVSSPLTTPRVNFTLNNDDTEKLWNFDDFNVLIEYESASGDELEELSFGGKCQGVVPIAGEWCIEGIAGDFLDAGILNEGESAEIWTQVSQSVENGNARVTVSTDNGEVAMLPAPKRSWFDASPVPPATCEFSVYGRTFVDTDTGISYVCDPSRGKWLSTETITIFGEEDDDCDSGENIGDHENCSPDFGDQLGVNSGGGAPDLGIYIPYNMTVIAYGFSADNDDCSGGSFDIEIWSTGSNSDDDNPANWNLEQEIDTGLTTDTENANDRNVDIAGDQYIMTGIENNCSGTMNDWNLIIYSKWRHDNP